MKNMIAGVDLDATEFTERQIVLIVEDDADTVFLLKQILVSNGFNVVSALNSQDALKKLADFMPNLVLLDLMMPEVDGWQTLKHIREMSNIPVIILSALNEKANVIKGLSMGADDYIGKPFFNDEVVERVKAVLRRSEHRQQVDRYSFPKIDLSIEFSSHQVIYKTHQIRLTPKEFDVFAMLVKSAPVVVKYPEITETIWGEDNSDARKRTKYLIYLIRQKFKKIDPNFELILNDGRLGYRLDTNLPK
jgi:DNA-binding response OmpR family regulator